MRRPRPLDILGTLAAAITLTLTIAAGWTGSFALLLATVVVALLGLALEPLAQRHRKRRAV